MHYTLVYADPPKTSGPLVPFLWLFCLRSIHLLIPDLPHCCPIKFLMVHSLPSNFLGCASMTPFCCAVTHPLLTDALILLYPFRIFGILLSWWLTPLPISLVMQLTHSFTQQLIHAPYAYSFLLIPCLLIAYKALTKPLPITYQSLTNSAYSLPFLYFNAVSPHVFKPPGLSPVKVSPNNTKLSLFQCPSVSIPSASWVL